MAQTMAPWRRELSKSITKQITGPDPQPLQREPLLEYLGAGNHAVTGEVARHVKANGPLVHPKKINGNWDFEVAIEQCTDARHVTMSLEMLLKYSILHDRDAGSVVSRAQIFLNAARDAIRIAEVHEGCGASKVAHQLRDLKVPEGLDANIFYLLTHIPAYVRYIADPVERNIENAVAQADKVRRILERAGKPSAVNQVYYSWSDVEMPYGRIIRNLSEAQGLGITEEEWSRKSHHGRMLVKSEDRGVLSDLSRTAVEMRDYALAEGRELGEQYAAITWLYDAYRLGRINDPRAIFGALANEMFCVTVNLRPFDPKEREPGDGVKERLSTTAMAGVSYANFDRSHGLIGNVRGVNETHMTGIIDTSEQVLLNVKKHLMDKYPEVRSVTENGANIVLAHYDRDSGKVNFIKD